jgi:cell shape-determining protein MreC
MQGLELGKITTIQQEKIKELFLHVIEMEKRLEKLEKENEELKSQLSEKIKSIKK